MGQGDSSLTPRTCHWPQASGRQGLGLHWAFLGLSCPWLVPTSWGDRGKQVPLSVSWTAGG